MARMPPTVAFSGQRGSRATNWLCLARVCWRVLPGAAGLDRAGEVLPGVFDDSVEAGQIEMNAGPDGIAPGLLCAASDGSDCEIVFVGEAENLGDLLSVGRGDG